ncbi:MAG: glycosyltransferase [Candidatus Sumerlaeia bacterium]|nr:glycosyltransferase [Candidatus Sumerlaeia bacterium]
MRRIPIIPLLARSVALLARRWIWAPRTVAQFQRRRKLGARVAAQETHSSDHRDGSVAHSCLLFFFSQVVWQDVWQRPQELALRLGAFLPVVYFSPLQIHRRYDSVPHWQPEIHIDRGRGVRVVQPLILPGEYKSRLIFALNRRLIWAEACRVLPPDADLWFLSNSPFSADLLARVDWGKRIYDLIDDFPGFSWAPPNARGLEALWLQQADTVISGTQALCDRHRAARPDIQFVPSGVRFDLFHTPPDSIPEDIRALPRPILGYTGTLSDRLDRRLLEDLCREFRDGSVVLIGPVHGSFDMPAPAPNLHLLGPKPHDRLPAYVHQFDLALLPFAINTATQAINPIKTLEYLAAGRVVISTAVPDVVRFFSNEVVIARDRAEFVRLARQWLTADSSALRQRGVDRARGCSWEQTAAAFARAVGLSS